MWAYPPRKILVAVDFGDASARALRIAGSLADAHGAAVTVLHAEQLEAPPYFTRAQVQALERQRAAARREAERFLETFAGRNLRAPATYVIVEGSPASGIAQAARSVDLVVMGTHGRRGPARWWAGSVAERVVRDAPVPVLVARADGAATPATLFRRIAVVAPPGSFDGSARRYARGLAAAFDGEPIKDSETSLSAGTVEGATLVVLAKVAHGPVFTPEATQFLRTCRRPILFVPSV